MRPTSVTLPSERRHLLKGPQPSQVAPQLGTKFEHEDLWEYLSYPNHSTPVAITNLKRQHGNAYIWTFIKTFLLQSYKAVIGPRTGTCFM